MCSNHFWVYQLIVHTRSKKWSFLNTNRFYYQKKENSQIILWNIWTNEKLKTANESSVGFKNQENHISCHISTEKQNQI